MTSFLTGLFDPNAATASGGYFANPNFTAMLGALQGLGAASGTSRLPITNGQVFGSLAGGLLQGEQAGSQNQLQQQQIQALQTKNALDKLSLAGYQRWHDMMGGAPATKAGAMAANMNGAGPVPFSLAPPMAGTGGVVADPTGRLVDATTGQRIGPVNPALNGVTTPAPSAGSAPSASDAPQMLRAPSAGITNDPRPLFDAGSIMRQYQIAAGSPAMAPLAAQLLGLLQKGVPEGAYLGRDGGIYARPGYNQFLANQEASKSSGSAPYKALESLLARAGQVHNIAPGEIGLTGFQTLPPDVQRAAMGLINNANAGNAPQAGGPSAVGPAASGASASGAPSTDATGFPTQPMRTAGGGIGAPRLGKNPEAGRV